MDAVNREPPLPILIGFDWLLANERREQVHEQDFVGLGDLSHRVGIHLQPRVGGVDVGLAGEVGVARNELVSDRREQHELGSRLAVVLLRERVLDEGRDVLLELGQPRLPRPRLVVAVEREDHVRLGVGQLEPILANLGPFLVPRRQLARLRTRSVPAEPLIVRPKRHRPHPMIRILPPINLIAGITEIANDQVVLRKPSLNQRLQPPVMLHPLGERAADDANVVPFVELQLLRIRSGSNNQRDSQDEPKMQFHYEIPFKGVRIPGVLRLDGALHSTGIAILDFSKPPRHESDPERTISGRSSSKFQLDGGRRRAAALQGAYSTATGSRSQA